MKNASVVTIVAVILVVIMCCCLCLAVATTGILTFNIFNSDTAVTWDLNPMPTPVVVRPTYEPVPTRSAGSGEVPLQDPVPFDLVPLDTLIALEQTIVPVNDLLELAERLEGKSNIPITVATVPHPYEVGDRYTFWVTNVDTNDNFQVETVLRYATEHAYFWIEDGVYYDEIELRDLAETFENQIYPTNREFFGSEWSPGVDGDPHLYIVYASGLGSSLAGYFSSVDAYHPLAHQYSNGHETFMLNADTVGLGEDFTYGVLAHEFQHMIHWYQDRNESTWLNEGFSELAAFLNGFDVGGSDWYFMRDPDLQLNDWPNDPDSTYPHYGSSFLFVTYFLDRFGEQATQAVVGHPDNGLTSIDAVLIEMGFTDPLTGEQIHAEDVFLDWAVTNYLRDNRVGDGRYDYNIYPDAPQADETETFRNCPFESQTRSVAQFGADYIHLTCSGDYQLRFEGSISVGLLPADPYSGDYAFWSNKGDESDMTLTQRFDFSQHEGPLTLSYWTWYDLEEDYDYLYLLASIDGTRWEILDTPSGTDMNPSGNSYGWGYNGLSGGDGTWIQEQVDLSRFAGQQVQLRFEYITDAAVNGEGFLLDDIAIPEIGYFSDFELDEGGWQAAGFVRIQNILPQYFRLALISYGRETTVEYLTLSADNVVEFDLPADSSEAVLVVTGTTPFTREKAAYRFEVLP